MVASAAVGLAWTGGGLTGLFASMCATLALSQLGPEGTLYTSNSTVLSVNSGGTLGSILMSSASKDHLRFPPSWDPSHYTYDLLKSKFDGANSSDNSVWFGAIDSLVHPFSVEVPEATAASSNWWLDALELAVKVYRLTEINAGSQPITAGISLLRAGAAPFKRDASGVMPNALDNLVPGELDLKAGTLKAVGNHTANFKTATGLGVLQAGSYSSAFWGVPIAELKPGLDFDAAKEALLQAPGQAADNQFYALDGGMVDTTGITALLRKKVRNIVVFGNQNSDLRVVNSSFAFLFGAKTVTDSQNSLEGPLHSQVFPTAEWPSSPSENGLVNGSLHILRQNLKVLDNSYFGVESYVLESLLVISTQLSEEFINEFPSSVNIKDKLDPRWPNKFEVGMPTIDANALCIYSGWKVQKFRELLLKPFN